MCCLAIVRLIQWSSMLVASSSYHYGQTRSFNVQTWGQSIHPKVQPIHFNFARVVHIPTLWATDGLWSVFQNFAAHASGLSTSLGLIEPGELGVRHAGRHVVAVMFQGFCMKVWWRTMITMERSFSIILVDFGGMYLPPLARAQGKTYWCCAQDKNLGIILQSNLSKARQMTKATSHLQFNQCSSMPNWLVRGSVFVCFFLWMPTSILRDAFNQCSSVPNWLVRFSAWMHFVCACKHASSVRQYARLCDKVHVFPKIRHL